MESIWTYLKEKELLDWVDTPPEYTPEQLEAKLGYSLPEDYKEMLRNCYCFSFEGEGEQIDFYNIGEVISFTTEMFYMAPLRGTLLIGSDRGGNMIGYDVQNRIGKGAFHLYFFGRTDLTLGDAKPLGANLREVAVLCNDEDFEGFFDLPSASQLGIEVKENPTLPDIAVYDLDDLIAALPPKAMFDGLEAELRLEEKEERVTGGYYALNADAVYLFSFGKDYQELYYGFAEGLLGYGNELLEEKE